MSRRLKQAAKEKDQTKINKYVESITKKETLKLAESADSSNSNEDISVTSISTGSPIPNKELVAFDTKQVTTISTGSPIPNKELVASTKRKCSQEIISPNIDQKKKINMSASPQEPQQPKINSQPDEIEDESTLSPELAKLERILSRKQAENLEIIKNDIKNDIKKLLENEELIKMQQNTITELKRENQELNIRFNRLEQKHQILQKRVVNIENEMYSSNLIFSGIAEGESEEGPERYRLIIEAIANTINAQTRDEQLQAARRIPIKKSTRIGKYNSRRGRPIKVQFVYQEDCEYLLANKSYLPNGVFVDRQYSEETENKRRILRPIYKAAKNHSTFRGRCTMEGEYLKIRGIRYSVDDINKLPEELNSFKCTSRETQDVLGFFGELNPLSNFYNCEFQYQNLVFHSSEQLIQYNKAKHFRDNVTMAQILSASTPLECKRLAREIVNYNEDNWRMVAKNMCFEGLKEKFAQNPSLVETLLKTDNKTLVECSFDRIWGNGVPLGDRSCMDRQKWYNVGILGEMLMEIRSQLRNQMTEMEEAPMDATDTNANE